MTDQSQFCSAHADFAESAFMLRNVPRFLNRFDLTYNREDHRIEYFISRNLSGIKFCTPWRSRTINLKTTCMLPNSARS